MGSDYQSSGDEGTFRIPDEDDYYSDYEDEVEEEDEDDYDEEDETIKSQSKSKIEQSGPQQVNISKISIGELPFNPIRFLGEQLKAIAQDRKVSS